MSIHRFQRTVASVASVSGFGYFTGLDVTVEFHPAKSGEGLYFVRSDLGLTHRIPVSTKYRVDAQRRTVLQNGDARVEMIEHVIAALCGLGIDNCEIRVNQIEMPGCDGSSLPFVQALHRAGIQQFEVPKRTYVIEKTIRVGDESQWIEASPTDNGCFSLEYQLDYGAGPIGRQQKSIVLEAGVFERELASARTFLLKAEADAMQSMGLGKRVTTNDLLIFGDAGPIENPLRFEDECVRHKMLDMIGDFGLSGVEWVGHFIGYRSGHRLNAALVDALIEDRNANCSIGPTIPLGTCANY